MTATCLRVTLVGEAHAKVGQEFLKKGSFWGVSMHLVPEAPFASWGSYCIHNGVALEVVFAWPCYGSRALEPAS